MPGPFPGPSLSDVNMVPLGGGRGGVAMSDVNSMPLGNAGMVPTWTAPKAVECAKAESSVAPKLLPLGPKVAVPTFPVPKNPPEQGPVTVAPTTAAPKKMAAKLPGGMSIPKFGPPIPKAGGGPCRCGAISHDEYYRSLQTLDIYCGDCWEKLQSSNSSAAGLLLGLQALRKLGISGVPNEISEKLVTAA